MLHHLRFACVTLAVGIGLSLLAYSVGQRRQAISVRIGSVRSAARYCA